jgi:hypothetical protein
VVAGPVFRVENCRAKAIKIAGFSTETGIDDGIEPSRVEQKARFNLIKAAKR